VTVPEAGTTFNTVLYVREGACSGAGAVQVACKNDKSSNGNETLTFQAPPNKDYWVFVDGTNSTGGNFGLEIRVVPTCGDGVLDVGEECDDGNKTNGDGCDSSCKIEAACGALNEGEPNPYNNATVIPSACGTFRIPSASILPVGDTDHFRVVNLPANAKVDAYAYLGTPGTCAGGSVLVLSLWKSPITTPGGSYGLCSDQTGSLACSFSATDGNCAKLTHTVATAGDYILKVHGSNTSSTVSSYGLVMTIR
jgi:cysteine-rich repeat protein